MPEEKLPDPHAPSFGNIPYLALPTLALIIIMISVAIAQNAEDRADRRIAETMTAQSEVTPTAVVTAEANEVVCTTIRIVEDKIVVSCPNVYFS
jgi:hypothetical protein